MLELTVHQKVARIRTFEKAIFKNAYLFCLWQRLPFLGILHATETYKSFCFDKSLFSSHMQQSLIHIKLT